MGASPFIIPIFIPQAGCPHQCVFCNQTAITATRRETHAVPDFLNRVQAEIQRFLAFKRDPGRPVELAFFGGNFLGLPPKHIQAYVKLAQNLHAAGQIDFLRFSTRPDTITADNLALLQNVPVSVAELGAQSMHNHVLELAGRGHTAQDTVAAVKLLQSLGFNAGLQIMPGLPGDSPASAFATGRRVAELKPCCVRIYPTLVLKDSPLAQMYHSGAYRPFSLEEAVNVSARLYKLFVQSQIKVIRMGLQASSELAPGAALLAGPHHPAFGHLVVSRLFLETVLAVFEDENPAAAELGVHPGQISHLRGLKNANMALLRQKFPHCELSVKAREELTRHQISINGVLYNMA